MKRHEAIAKIERCFRLGASPYLNEAQTAQRQGFALMAEHGVDVRELWSTVPCASCGRRATGMCAWRRPSECLALTCDQCGSRPLGADSHKLLCREHTLDWGWDSLNPAMIEWDEEIRQSAIWLKDYFACA